MRLGLFIAFFVATFAMNWNIIVGAEKVNAAGNLKGTQTDDLTAESEERSPEDIKTMYAINDALKANGLFKPAMGKASTSVAAAAAKQQKAFVAMKSFKKVEAQTSGTATATAKNWKELADDIGAGARMKELDTSSPKWKGAFTIAKQNSPRSLTESQAAKITEAAAQQIAKHPRMWNFIMTFLEVSFGFAVATLAFGGIKSMVST